jgi:D-alanine-D-alanine ligase
MVRMPNQKIKIGVLRGGPSSEYEVSLKTGEHVLSILRGMPDKFETTDILISRDGDWHIGGLRRTPHKAVLNLDLVVNALHGAYGEDGQVQQFLEDLKIPYTGSKPAPSSNAYNKDRAKEKYRLFGLLTPQHELITEDNFNDETLINIFQTYMHPVVVKPATSGSSVGLHLARSFEELKMAVKTAFTHSPKVLVEEQIQGKNSTCVVLENARGQKYYAFLPTGELSTAENKKIEEASRMAHEALGLRHYSSSDFVITPKGRVYILETDSLPAFHPESKVDESLKITGWKDEEFLGHIINLADLE